MSSKTIWYHGSPVKMELLREGSTITRWKELAEAFSHKPPVLCIDDQNEILHNGEQPGYLYHIDEELLIGEDIYQHPRTTMEEGLEFLTRRLLRLKLLYPVPAPDSDVLADSQRKIEALIQKYK